MYLENPSTKDRSDLRFDWDLPDVEKNIGSKHRHFFSSFYSPLLVTH